MINISILDDDKFICEIIYDLITNILHEKNIESSIKVFNHPKTFLQCLDETDLLFLDITMPEISGVEISRKMYEDNKNTCIVFLTSHPEFVYEAFKVKAFSYMIKPIEKHELEDLLNDYLDLNPCKIEKC